MQDMSRIFTESRMHVEKTVLLILKTFIPPCCYYRTMQTQILSKYNSLLI